METNARIKSTMLGTEDHGVMTFWLYLDYGGAGQGFGGYVLDEYEETRKQRVGTRFGLQAIMDVLRVTGVSSWEKLPGTPVRVRAEHSKVHALGHYLKDKWLDLDALARDLIPTEGEQNEQED